jgi:hypothetical protein
MITAAQAYNIYQASLLTVDNIMLKIIKASLNGKNYITLQKKLPKDISARLTNDGFIVTDFQITWNK